MTEVDPCEVYVRYLPRTCDEARLRAQFEKCGRIVRARVAKDRDTGECKGYGFMTFSNKTEARRCVREYNEHPRNYMDGKHAVITHATASNPNKRPVAMCSFGVHCRRSDCHFRHPDGWDPDAEPDADAGAENEGGDGDGDVGDGDGKSGGDENPSKKQKRDKKKDKKKDERDERETRGKTNETNERLAVAAADDADDEPGSVPEAEDADSAKPALTWLQRQRKLQQEERRANRGHKHKLGAKARKRAKAREAKAAAAAGGGRKARRTSGELARG